jgi:hypothetical protein
MKSTASALCMLCLVFIATCACDYVQSEGDTADETTDAAADTDTDTDTDTDADTDAGTDDECCSEIGQEHECWMEDATDDGATCSEDDDCPSGACDKAVGLCSCSDDDECNDGVCADNGLCAPSWCNGYKICSCWGGCIAASASPPCGTDETCFEGDYATCTDSACGTGSCAVGTDDECCSEIGQEHECWMEDAADDGATCSEDDDCPSGACNEAAGLCTCTTESQCNDGVCADNGLCAPSWCNGYKICSGWGGCIAASASPPCGTDETCFEGDYATCTDSACGTGSCG